MYSSKFRKWLFNYLGQSGVQNATGKKKAEMLDGLLNSCNDCENEADFEDIKLICAYESSNGLASVRSIVTRSSNLKKDLVVQSRKGKTGSKKASKKSGSQDKAPIGIADNRAPLEYTVVSARDVDDLIRDVNIMLETGQWYLAGGVSVMTVAKVGSLHTQALFRY